MTEVVVRSAVARTVFARPVIVSWPPGGQVLVGVPVFFQASFPGAGSDVPAGVGPRAGSGGGYRVGQVHTVRLLGQVVRVRVAQVSFRWSFGDGSSLVTSSAGGPWPQGDVRHAYEAPGAYRIEVVASYRGEVSVDGGSWVRVDAVVPIAARPVRLIAVTAENQLLPNPS